MFLAVAASEPPLQEWLLSAGVGVWFLMVVIAMVRLEKTKHRRDPMGQLGWAVAILCLPVMGALCWFFFDHAATQAEKEKKDRDRRG